MSGIQVKLYQTDNGPCPYRDDKTWHNLSFQTSELPPDGYTSLLNQGFRRSGLSIYHPVCSGCQSCIPIRVDVQNFSQNKGQRRTWRKNEDVRVFVFDPEFVSKRLGVFSLLYEIEYARFLDIRWLYLGYWVENSPKMNYKADFQPTQILRNSRWIPFKAQQRENSPVPALSNE